MEINTTDLHSTRCGSRARSARGTFRSPWPHESAERTGKWLITLNPSPIIQVSATDTKNRFVYYLGQAEREPVQIMKNDRVAAVMVSAARYADLEALERTKTLGQRKREFNETYSEWIAAQKELVERVGVFGEDYRPW